MVAMSGRSPHSYKRELKIGLAAQMDRNSTSENVLSPSGEKAHQLPTYPKSQSAAWGWSLQKAQEFVAVQSLSNMTKDWYLANSLFPNTELGPQGSAFGAQDRTFRRDDCKSFGKERSGKARQLLRVTHSPAGCCRNEMGTRIGRNESVACKRKHSTVVILQGAKLQRFLPLSYLVFVSSTRVLTYRHT